MQTPSRRASISPFARRALCAGAATLTILCSCSKAPQGSDGSPSPAPTAAPTPAPPPTPTPAPTPPAAPTPTPVVRHFAPEGTFFVTEEVTVRLPAGIMGVPPGTQVKLVKDKGETATVNDGTHDFDIKTSQLTNDLDEAAKVQKSAQYQEQAGAAFRQQQQAALEKQQQAQIEFLRTHPLGGNTTGTPTPPRR